MEEDKQERNTDRIDVRMTPALKDALEREAKRLRVTLADWVRATLARAAEEYKNDLTSYNN